MKLYTKLARLYDEMYQHIFDYDAQASLVDSILKQQGARTVLEVGCGSGHLAKRLQQKGYAVTGVDLNEEMVEIAREHAKDVMFLRGDMRSLDLKRTYDAVVVLGRGFTYMTTNEDANAALASFYRLLKKGGVLVFDNFDAKKTLTSNHDGVREFDLEGKQVKRSTHTELKLDDAVCWLWKANYEITAGGKTTYVEDESLLRSFFKSELELLLQHNRFKVIDFRRDDFLLVVAQK